MSLSIEAMQYLNPEQLYLLCSLISVMKSQGRGFISTEQGVAFPVGGEKKRRSRGANSFPAFASLESSESLTAPALKQWLEEEKPQIRGRPR